MDRGREGRRGGGGGGLVHAPRRPRTGFKDAAVGDDGDDMMDDVHNSRLRERSKKDGGGVTSGHGVATSTVGPSSRNKRKRQGSQEVQVHARNSPADEVEETTEDTEMGVSEDDDDPPPPIIIPRRPGKPRPQAKFAEDGIAMDLPAVPRKARTAMGKRPHEAATPPVAESPAHGAAVAASAPAPSSTPSSSSIASLKPGRRTKPSGSKPRGHKLAKVSAPSLVSEQEVEVAEALFDLARMFTQPPPSESKASESKGEAKVSPVNEVKSEAKLETKASGGGSGSSLPPPAPNGGGVVNEVKAGGASGAGGGGGVRGSSPGAGSAASPAPSSPAPGAGAAPVAEAAKRKRPRVRTRTEDGGARAAPITASGGGGGVGPGKDGDGSSGRAATAERSGVKLEKSGAATSGVGASANNVGGSASNTGGIAGASSGMGASGGAPTAAAAAQDGVAGGSVGRVERSVVEKKVAVQAEKKVVNGGVKAEGASSNSQEKRVAGSPVREKKVMIGEAAAPAAPAAPAVASANATANVSAAVEAAPNSSIPVGAAATTTKMEVEKRSPGAAAAGPSDVDHVPKRDIDLMVAPSKGDGEEKDEESGDGDVREASEKRVVDADVAPAGSAATAGAESSWAEREREREAQEKERLEMERGREKERERESERERVERQQRREFESQRELAKEREREKEKEREREREKEREKEKERERERDRETEDRERDRDREKDHQRQRIGHREHEHKRESEREGHREHENKRESEREHDQDRDQRSRGLDDDHRGSEREHARDPDQPNISTTELEDRLARMREERRKANLDRRPRRGIRASVKPEEEDDIAAWVNKSRQMHDEKKKAEEREKAARMAKALEEQENEEEDSDDDFEPEPESKYSAKDLAGLKVRHGLDRVMEGGAIVLTLKDTNILAEGDVNEEADVLENFEMAQQIAREDAYKAAKKVPGKYEDKFNNEMTGNKTILSKYDEAIKEEGVTLDESGGVDEEAQKKLEDIRRKLQHGMGDRLSESLLTGPSTLANEYLTQDEMTTFKKPKKKKKLRKKDKLDLDALEAEAKAEGLGTIDMGSRDTIARRAQMQDDMKAAADARRERYENAVAKAADASRILKEGSEAKAMDVDEPEEVSVGAEEEEVLQRSLDRARQAALKNLAENPSGPQAIAARLAAAKQELPQAPGDGDAEEGKLIISDTGEFCRSLQLDEALIRRSGPKDVFHEEEEKEEGELDPTLDEEAAGTSPIRGRWTEVGDAEMTDAKDIPEMEEDSLDEVKEVAVGKGLAGVLQLLKERGSLKETVDWGGRNMDKKKSKLVGIVDESNNVVGQRDILLDRVDEFGRTMTPKEAFRKLSHKFHGKGPGKMKQEKRQKQFQEELKLKQMNAGDTPLMAMEKIREAQAKLHAPYLVISGHIKPGQTSDPRSGFATVEKEPVGSLTPMLGDNKTIGSLTPMLGDKKVAHFLGIKRKPESGSMGPPPNKKPKDH